MILLISDIHLQIGEPETINSFLTFLRCEAIASDALYILGDLFDIWIGDDDLNLLNHEIASAFRNLVDSGVPCYFIHGNHDFLIGQKFAKRSGIILLPEEQVISLYEYKVLIMHGDTLCTNDRKYQSFRTTVRTLWVQRLFLSLPLSIRDFFVKKIRARNNKTCKNKGQSPIGDINLQTVIKVMKKHKVKWLICGHVHHLHIRRFTTNNQSAFCFFLGAWHRNSGSMLKITPKKIELIGFTLN